MNEADATWWARARSMLFVPGTRPYRFDKAVAANADAVVVDLEHSVEHSVEPDDKAAARVAVDSWIGGRTHVVLRINAFDSPWASDDLAMVAGGAAVMLPKATIESMTRARGTVPAGVPLFALVEIPRGVTDLVDLCQVGTPLRLCFGGIDCAMAMGVSSPGGPLADDARARIAVVAAVSGQGATVVGGQIADRPVVERARRLLASNDELGEPAR
jgi:citrate lyase subunit beta/citryl-CoA lyase